MKKVLLIIFWGCLMHSYNFAQSYGDKEFPYPVIQEQGTWCVHACLEMVVERKASQCHFATIYANEFRGYNVLTCCNLSGSEYYYNACIKEGVSYSLLGPYMIKAIGRTMGGTKLSTVIEGMKIRPQHTPFPCILPLTEVHHAVVLFAIDIAKLNDSPIYGLHVINPANGKHQYIQTTNPEFYELY